MVLAQEWELEGACRCLRSHESVGGVRKVVSWVENPPDTPNEIITDVGPGRAQLCQN